MRCDRRSPARTPSSSTERSGPVTSCRRWGSAPSVPRRWRTCPSEGARAAWRSSQTRGRDDGSTSTSTTRTRCREKTRPSAPPSRPPAGRAPGTGWRSRYDGASDAAAGEGGPEPWRRLAQGVGVDRQEVAACRPVLPGVRFACDGHVHLVRERSLVEAVASSLTEFFSPDLMTRRVLAWERHYPWID